MADSCTIRMYHRTISIFDERIFIELLARNRHWRENIVLWRKVVLVRFSELSYTQMSVISVLFLLLLLPFSIMCFHLVSSIA